MSAKHPSLRICSITALLLLWAFCAYGQTTITIGSGTGSQRYPIGSYYGYERTVSIYHASEIGSSGTINSVGWYASSTRTFSLPIRIYLKQTPLDSVPTESYATTTTGATLVYDGTFTGPTVVGWTPFTITPFAYDASYNLMVITETNYGGYGNSTSGNAGEAYYATNHFVGFGYMQLDNTPPTGNWTISSLRPNVQFSFVPDASAPGIPSLTSPASGATGIATNASLNWSSGSNTTNVDVYLSTSYSEVYVKNSTALRASAITGSTYSYPMTGGSTYYWRIVARNATTGQTTDSPIWSFSTYLAALSGSYSIGVAGGNYPSFTAAINALTLGGVGAGGVTFHVQSGIYNERIAIPPITGVSADNQILFQKASGTVTIRSAGTSSTNDYLVKLNGCDYVTFDGIDIENSGTSSSDFIEYGYFITNYSGTDGATHNTIKNGWITLTPQTTTYGIFHSYTTTPTVTGTNSYNQYLDLKISKCRTGVYVYGYASYRDVGNFVGSSDLSLLWANRFTIGAGVNDTIGGPGQSYGVSMFYQDSPTVSGVDVFQQQTFNTGLSSYGIFLSSYFGAATICNNRVGNYKTYYNSTSTNSSAYGIYVAGTSTTATASVRNNFIYHGVSTSARTTASASRYLYGIYAGAGSISILHNSVLLDQGIISSTTDLLYSSACLEVGSTSGIYTISNNIFANITSNQTGVAKHYGFYRGSGTIAAENNNLFFIPNPANGFIGYYSSTDYADLATWRTGTGFDGASISGDPLFQNSSYPYANLHLEIPSTTPADNAGQSGTGVLFDIDNMTRSTSTPDIGADEGDFGTPAVPANPYPADNATNVPQNPTLSWTSPNATSYDIYFGSTYPPTYVTSVTSPVREFSGLYANTRYYWHIVSYINSTSTPGPFWSFMTTEGAAPATPSNLHAIATTDRSITVSWTDESTNEGGFRLYRSTDSASFEMLFSSRADCTSYCDDNHSEWLTPCQRYFYQVVAYNAIGQSGICSSPAIWTNPVAANLSISPYQGGYNAVSFLVESTNHEPNYRIQDSISGLWVQANGTLGATPLISGTFVDFIVTGLTPNTLYAFRAITSNGSGQEATSSCTYYRTADTHNAGPDDGGYYLRDSYATYGPPFAWETHNTPSIPTFSNQDDGNSSALPLGFTFSFYGVDYSTVTLSTNGFLSFGTPSTTAPTAVFPQTTHPAGVYFWARDLHVGYGGTTVSYETLSNPTRFVATFDSIAVYNASSQRFSAQVILYSSGEIRFNYRNFYNTPATGVAGIQNNLGGISLSYATTPSANSSVRFARLNSPTTPTPINGASGVATLTTLKWDGTGLSYDLRLALSSSSLTTIATGIQTNSYPITGLQSGVSYQWQVIAHAGRSDSVVSPIWTFTTSSMGYFTGQIVEMYYGTGLDGVSLDIDGVTTTTNSSGIFGIPLTIGTHTVLATKTGFYPNQFNISVPADTLITNFMLKRIPYTFIHPTFGDILNTGETDTIRWTSHISASQVTIQLNRTYPSGSWETIGSGISNNGAFVWTVSGLTSTTARFRIATSTLAEQSVVNDSDITIRDIARLSFSPIPLTQTLMSGDTLEQTVSLHNIGTAAFTGQFPYGEIVGTSSYSIMTSADAYGPSTSLITIPGTATYGPSGDDSVEVAAYSFPFPFPYHGTTYSSAYMCTNGFLRLGTTPPATSYSNSALPAATMGALIAPLWDDLYVAGSTSHFYDSDNHRLVFSWTQTRIYSGDPTLFDFQVLLYKNGMIEFRYSGASQASTPTVGIQNETGTQYTQFNYMTEPVPANYAIRFQKFNNFCSSSATTFSIPAGGEQSFSVLWNARTEPVGTLYGSFFITGNASNSPFVIPTILNVTEQPSTITLIHPVGGEQFIIDSSVTIQFSATHATNGIQLQLNRFYPGTTWDVLVDSVSGSATEWVWNPITGPSTSNARIRAVVRGSSPVESSTSGSDFSILAPSLQLVYPNGGEVSLIGHSDSIVVNMADLPHGYRIQLDRSYPSGTWETIADSVTTTVHPIVTVSGPATTRARLRVLALGLSGMTIGDTSNADFTIRSSGIVVTRPNGGEVLRSGYMDTIRYSTYGYSGYIRIELNRYYPLSGWETLTDSATSSAGYWLWNPVNGATSTNARIRVSIRNQASVCDTSDANFSISSPLLQLKKPTGGETYFIGSIDTIRWASTGNLGNVRILLNRNYPTTGWDTLFSSTANDGYELWTVTGAPTNSARIKIISVLSQSISAMSDSNFTLSNRTVTITSPVTGDVIYTGMPDTIRYTTTNYSGLLRIELNRNYPNGLWTTITDTASALQPYWVWSSVTSPTTTMARMRISTIGLANQTVESTVGGNFTISSPTVAVLHPTSGQKMIVGTIDSISWQSTGISGNIHILLYRDTTATADTLFANVPNSGTRYWLVTSPTTSYARFRLVSVVNPSLSIYSQTFQIETRSIQLTSPNGGDVWNGGSYVPIQFTATNCSNGIQIELNRNYPNGSWEMIADSASSTTTAISWLVSGASSTNARIRAIARGFNRPPVGDTSNADFSILVRTLDITKPTRQTAYVIGAQDTIKWLSSSVTGNVNIELNRNYPAGSWERLFSSIANTGMQLWTPSGTTGQRMRMRIFTSDSCIWDTSNYSFSIGSPPQFTQLDTGHVFIQGTTDTLRWNTGNIPGTVTIELHVGTSWIPILDGTYNDGEAPWFVPVEAVGGNQLRIRSNRYSTAPMVSASISVKNPMVWTSLMGTAPTYQQVGSQLSLVWNTQSIGGTVQIQINRNYPAGDWVSLTPNTSNTGTYAWTVTGPATTNARLRFISNTNPLASDTTVSPLVIYTSPLVLTSPVGGDNIAINVPDTIRWTSTNLTGSVFVYTSVNGTAYSYRGMALVSAGQYVWTPTAVSTTTYVRIRSATISTIADTSDQFTVSTYATRFLTPTAGMCLTRGVPDTIRWIASFSGPITLQYMTHDSSFGTIATSISSASGSFVWTPTFFDSGTRLYIRTYTYQADATSGVFSIAPYSMDLQSPVTGDTLFTGMPVTIAWQCNGYEGNFNLFYRPNTEMAWTTIVENYHPIGSVNPYSGSFSFVVPRLATRFAQFRVQAVTGTSATLSYDTTGFITIMNCPWTTGRRINTRNTDTTRHAGWTPPVPPDPATNNFPPIHLQFSATSGAHFNPDSVNTWYNPPVVASDEISESTKINREWHIEPSSEEFESVDLSLFFTSNDLPTGMDDPGTAYPPCSSYMADDEGFTWTYRPGSIVVERDTTGEPITYSFNVLNVTHLSKWIVSNAGLAPTLQNNNGGSTLMVGSTDTIKWVSNAREGTYTIELNRNYPSGTWETIATDLFDDSSYVWTVTGSSSTTLARIRILSNAYTTDGDTSNANFTISVPSIYVTSHATGDSIYTGLSDTLRFSATNASQGLKVEINRTYPSSSWTTLADSISGSSSYWVWTSVTSPLGNSTRFRVSARGTGSTLFADTTSANTSILERSIFVTAPAGGEVYYVGDVDTLRWSSVGISGNVKIEISRTSGSWTTLIASTPNDGVHPWTVVTPTSSTVLFRVSSISYTTIKDTSNANITIAQRSLTLTHPNGGDHLYIGRSDTIQFTANYLPLGVKIEVNTNYPSGGWSVLKDSVGSSDGKWCWTGFGTETTNARVRLTALGFGSSYVTTSNSNFDIKRPSIDLARPNGGETIYTSRNDSIRFSASNAPYGVSIEANVYYPAGEWTTLADSVSAGIGSWTWAVSTSLVTNYAGIRVSVRGLNEQVVADSSASTFTIMTLVGNPAVPGNVQITRSGTDIQLDWSAVTLSEFGVPMPIDGYHIYFKANYEDASWTLLGSTSGTTYTITGATALGKRYYWITAYAAGSASAPTYQPPPPLFDTFQKPLRLK